MENPPLETPMPRTLLAALPALLLCGCPTPETDVHALTPVLAVAPDSLDFGEVVVDYQAEERIELINSGKAPLTISSIAWADGSSEVFDKDLDAVEVARDERAELYLTCLPTTYDAYAATLLISSNDPEHPEVELPVACTGVHAPTPDIELDPESLDFGEVEVGQSVTEFVTLRNVGDDPLHVASTIQSGSGAFEVVTDPEGATVDPDGDEYVVIITYTPTAATGDYGQLTIVSDDPDEASLPLLLLGNCESADDCEYEYPVAVIEGPTETDPLETLALDGSGSYDPRDEELTYQWELSQLPAGSIGQLTSVVGEQADLYVDLAGDYQVQLVVINESGVSSAPAKHDIEAIPSDKIHVEMFWDAGESDLDLHLAIEDTPIFEEPTDCNYCNPNPDWGTSGATSDDPSLDLDDVAGYGPENINIASPDAGGYDVHVHYFRDNGAGAVTATVRVYIDGEVGYEASDVMEYDDRWFVGTVLWPDAVLSENEGEPITNGGQRGCYEPED